MAKVMKIFHFFGEPFPYLISRGVSRLTSTCFGFGEKCGRSSWYKVRKEFSRSTYKNIFLTFNPHFSQIGGCFSSSSSMSVPQKCYLRRELQKHELQCIAINAVVEQSQLVSVIKVCGPWDNKATHTCCSIFIGINTTIFILTALLQYSIHLNP